MLPFLTGNHANSCTIKYFNLSHLSNLVDVYRSTMKGLGGIWTEANLDKYLKSPADYAPGNAMAFAGIPNAKDRADLVSFLKTKAAEPEA